MVEKYKWSSLNPLQLGRYAEYLVKSMRGMYYIYFPKEKSTLRDNLLVVIGLFKDGDLPRLYLIPATEWNSPNALLVDRDYEGLKSKPEYGLNISQRNLSWLERYRFEQTVRQP